MQQLWGAAETIAPQSLGGQHAIPASARAAAKQNTAEFITHNAANTTTTVRTRH